MKKGFLAVVLAALLSGCAGLGDEYNRNAATNAVVGGAIGAATGAVIGSMTGDTGKGAAIGGLAGSWIWGLSTPKSGGARPAPDYRGGYGYGPSSYGNNAEEEAYWRERERIERERAWQERQAAQARGRARARQDAGWYYHSR